ncbi:MAG: SusC/RagA family TonB-linked outer membrane protein [Bacteroidota bacterium]
MKLKFDAFIKLAFVLLAVAWSGLAFGQRSISGTLTDAETGEALFGANVLVVGAGTGTVSDLDGKYTVTVPEGYTQLEYSYTGYASQVVEIGASDVIDIILSAGSLLDEVVVVGYGTQTRKEVTSSVVSVKAEDFNQGNVTSPTQLLQGKVAGLSIARPGSDPNGGFTVRLRGLSTFGANLEPLVVVDGVPGFDLANIDPNDIASIDVLKDGSAAAIYGTRGSSGVILITTKKGDAGGGLAKVEYNGFVSIDQVLNRIPVMSSSEYTEVGGTDLGSSTDWFEEITQTGISHVHNVALSGGSSNTTYRFSVNFRDGQGILRNSGFDRLNGRMNITQKALDDRLTLTMNLAGSRQNSDFSFNEAFRYATYYNPTAPILDESQEEFDGYFQLANFDYFNPVSIIEQNINEGEFKRLNADFRASLEIVEGLDVSAFYAQQSTNELLGEYYSRFSRFRGSDRGGLARRITNDFSNQLFEATANYNRSFGDLDFGLLAGYSYQDFENEGTFIEAGEFLTDGLTFDDLESSEDFQQGEADVSSYKNTDKIIAFFGRVNLNYDDTYYLQGSLRREGSSRFGLNNKWGLFPAVSAGLDIAKLAAISSVDLLKLRVGYGVTGNNIGESYRSIVRFAASGNNYPVDGGLVAGYGPISNANLDLQWEVKREFNAGIDFAIADYKLTGSLDFYTRNIEDLILEVDVPATTNFFPTNFVNLGQLQSSGLELALGVIPVSNENLTYSFDVTGTYFLNNEIVSLNNEFFQFAPTGQIPRANLGAPGLNETELIILQENAPVGQIWGPQFVGINPDGTFNLVNQNGDVNDDGEPIYNNDDNVVIGNGLPDFELGWNNTVNIGNLTVNLFFRGTFGHDLINTYRIFYEQLNAGSIGSYNRVKTEFFDPALTEAPRFSDYYVEDATFLKLDNATIGYNFDLSEDASFNRLRVYVSGQNLFILTNYTGIDPEARWQDTGTTDNGGRPLLVPDALSPGIERRSTYFTARTFVIGINAGF